MRRAISSMLALIPVLAAWVGMCVITRTCPAQQRVEVTCSVSADSCYAGDGVDYVVNVSGSSGPERPTVDLPSGLSMEFVNGSDRSSRFVAIVNGKRDERVEEGYVFQYRLSALRAGQFVVPAPRVKVNGKEYSGTPVRLRVLEPESDDGFALSISVDNPRPYVGEPVRLRVAWRLATNVKNISIAALPGQDAFELATPHDRVPTGQQNDPTRVEFQMFGRAVVGVWTQETVRGQTVRVLNVEQVLVPREAGTVELGPLSVACDAVVGQKPRTFFDAPWDARDVTKRVVTRSGALKLDVRPLPEAGRPKEFGGLVGEYSLNATLSADKVGVGDPFTLRLTMNGPDPLARIELPALEDRVGFAESFKVSPEGWKAESGPESNPRTASISIRATDPRVSAVPSIEIPFFDPKRGEYRVARSGAIPITVRPTKVVTSADAIGGTGKPASVGRVTLTPGNVGLEANSESIDVLRDEGWTLRDAASSPVGVTILGVPPIAFAWATWLARRGTGDSAARQRLWRAKTEAMRRVRNASDATAVCEAIQMFAGALLGRDGATLTAEESSRAISARWPSLGGELGAIVSACDAARFGATTAEAATLRNRAEAWLAQFDRKALRRVLGENGRAREDRCVTTNSLLEATR